MYIDKLRCQKPKSNNRKTISKHWAGKVIFFLISLSVWVRLQFFLYLCTLILTDRNSDGFRE